MECDAIKKDTDVAGARSGMMIRLVSELESPKAECRLGNSAREKKQGGRVQHQQVQHQHPAAKH